MAAQKGFGLRIAAFLNNVIDDFKPDFIVTIERKGTALLRSKIESGEIDWSWNKVLSISSIGPLDTSILQDKRVLVFDDSIHHGHSIKRTCEKLPKGIILKRAVFAIHQNCQLEIPPEYYFYRDLSDEKFIEIKKQVRDYLQDQGSLLLDTEHIEISVRLHKSLSQFCDKLAKIGRVVDFSSGPRNIMVYKPLLNNGSFVKILPKNSNYKDGVWKCRIIVKGPDLLSMIPLCYPIIPVNIDAEDRNLLPKCIRNLINGDSNYETNFHAIGLHASIEIVKNIFSCFAEDDGLPIVSPVFSRIEDPQEDVGLSLREKADLRKNDTLSHLRAKFPNLDTPKLRELQGLIRNVISNALKTSVAVPRKFNIETLTYEELLEIRNKLVKTLYDYCSVPEPLRPNGMSLYELNSVMHEKYPKYKNHQISAATDLAIDEGLVATKVEEHVSKDGCLKCYRTFQPAGEFISSQIFRNYYDL